MDNKPKLIKKGEIKPKVKATQTKPLTPQQLREKWLREKRAPGQR